jgi:hypothetical protein
VFGGVLKEFPEFEEYLREMLTTLKTLGSWLSKQRQGVFA